MIPAPTMEKVRETALRKGRERFQANPHSLTRMIGILLAPSHLARVRDELWPAIGYWDARSGKHIDFYWVGYSAYRHSGAREVERFSSWSSDSRDQVVRYFDAQAFNQFRIELRDEVPSWRYSGGLELLLMNVEYLPGMDSVRFDFDSALTLDLEKGIGRELFGGSIPNLFEQIFDYAETQEGDDPTWGFGQTIDIHGKSRPLLGFIMSFIRRDAVDMADASLYVRDIVSHVVERV